MRTNITKLEQEQSLEEEVHFLLISFIHTQDLCRTLLLPCTLVFAQHS